MIKLVLLGLGFDLNPASELIVGGIAIKVLISDIIFLES